MGLVPDYFPMRRCGLWMRQPGAWNKIPGDECGRWPAAQPRRKDGLLSQSGLISCANLRIKHAVRRGKSRTGGGECRRGLQVAGVRGNTTFKT